MSTALRFALLIVVAAAFVFLLFTVVFPWVDRQFLNDPVLGLLAALPS